MDPSILRSLRYSSKGYQSDPPALFHPCIMVGPGSMLTPEFVKKHEITHVINCAFNENSPTWFREQNPSKYFCIEAQDSVNVNIMKWYPLFEKTLSYFLKDLSSKKIFVHCQMGINRSAFLTLAYVCKTFNYEMNRIFFSTLRQRPCMYQNDKFYRDVNNFLSIK
jgi:protein-tyrosine phosphatase